MLKKRASGDRIDTIIGYNTTVKGSINTSEGIRVDGKIEASEGGLVSSSEQIVIGSEAEVKSNIEGKRVIVAGRVEGNIECIEALELLSTGSITGDVQTQSFYMEQGGLFEGNCKMSQTSEGSLSGEDLLDNASNQLDNNNQPETISSSPSSVTLDELEEGKKIWDQGEDDDRKNTDKADQHASLEQDSDENKFTPQQKTRTTDSATDVGLGESQVSSKDIIYYFHFNDKYEIEKCPQEKTPAKSEYKSKKKHTVAYFNKSDCKQCYWLDSCIVKEQKEKMFLKISQKAVREVKE